MTYRPRIAPLAFALAGSLFLAGCASTPTTPDTTRGDATTRQAATPVAAGGSAPQTFGAYCDVAAEILATTQCSIELPPNSDPSEAVTIRGPQQQLPHALTAAIERANAVSVHAVDLGTPLSAYGELLTSPEIVERVEQESTKVVTEARDRVTAAHPDLAVTTALPTGSPSGALLHAAEGARVLVVGSARKNKAECIVLGTTSLSVVAHTP